MVSNIFVRICSDDFKFAFCIILVALPAPKDGLVTTTQYIEFVQELSVSRNEGTKAL